MLRDPGQSRTETATKELGEDYDRSGWTAPDAVVPAVVWLASERPAPASPAG